VISGKGGPRPEERQEKFLRRREEAWGGIETGAENTRKKALTTVVEKWILSSCDEGESLEGGTASQGRGKLKGAGNERGCKETWASRGLRRKGCSDKMKLWERGTGMSVLGDLNAMWREGFLKTLLVDVGHVDSSKLEETVSFLSREEGGRGEDPEVGGEPERLYELIDFGSRRKQRALRWRSDRRKISFKKEKVEGGRLLQSGKVSQGSCLGGLELSSKVVTVAGKGGSPYQGKSLFGGLEGGERG